MSHKAKYIAIWFPGHIGSKEGQDLENVHWLQSSKKDHTQK